MEGTSAVTTVIVHPLVLLSTVDHYNRVAKDTNKRVVGALLGETYKGKVDVTNSFAIPFDEDKNDPNVWYLDHNFLEEMFNMYKKINASEKLVGFYSTGPKIRGADLLVDELFRRYHANPVFVIIDVRADVEGMPVQAYHSVEEVRENGKETVREFKHITSEIGAYEAEEVGVETLLRDINDPSVSSLAAQVRHKISSLKGLAQRLEEIQSYLKSVLDGDLPQNNQVLYNLQDIFNLLPNLNLESLSQSMVTKTSDMHLIVYLASLIRGVTSLHDLVNNKIKYCEVEQARDAAANGEKKEEKKEGKTEAADSAGDSSGKKEAKE